MTSIWTSPAVLVWSQYLLDSFRRWTGRDLIARFGSKEGDAEALFGALFVVVS
ncbi:MAG: MEKHLA domain-containing protein, partial [Nitrospira sp.]|nr:MEKHLA domain-containing protein [Nitrospira sp.]